MPPYLFALASPPQLASARGLHRSGTAVKLVGTLLAALCLPASALDTVGNAVVAKPAIPAAFPAEKFQPQGAPLAHASRANSSALGVDQVRNLPASEALAMPAQPPASPSQLKTLQQPAIRSTASQPLHSARVQSGSAPKAAKQLSVSASCENADSGAECLLPGRALPDWRKNIEVEIDPVTGDALIPGNTRSSQETGKITR